MALLPVDLVPHTAPSRWIQSDGERWFVVDADHTPAAVLNRTGAALWQMLDGTTSIGALVAELAGHYGGDDAIGRDIDRLLRQLHRRELVSFGTPASGFEPATYHVNRSSILVDHLKDHGWRPCDPGRIAEFSMWWPLRSGPRPGYRQLFEPWQTREIDSKNGLYRALRRHRLEALAPDTWDDLDHFLDTAGQAEDEAFFVKKAISGRQVGIRRVFGAAAAAAAWREFSPHPCVVQREVREPMLLQGHKFNVRSFVLVLADGRSFLHRRSSVDLMPVPHDPAIQDPARHYTISGGNWFRSDRIAEYPAMFEAIRASLHRCSALFSELATAPVDPSRYAVFGTDYLIDRHGNAHLLELNHTPHLARGAHPEVSLWIKQHMLQEALRIALDGDAADTEFVALGAD